MATSETDVPLTTTGASLTLLTVMPSVFVVVSGPPVPVWLLSLVAMVSVSLPLKSVLPTYRRPFSAARVALIAFWVAVIVIELELLAPPVIWPAVMPPLTLVETVSAP